MAKWGCVQVYIRVAEPHLAQLQKGLAVEGHVSKHCSLGCPGGARCEANCSNIVRSRAELGLSAHPTGYDTINRMAR